MDELSKVLSLSEEKKSGRGLLHTPREIYQQPETWPRSYRNFAGRAPEVEAFLSRAGVPREAGERPTVFLVGAGTSDYIGRSLAALLRQMWQCEVQAVASTDLLTSSDELMLRGRPYLWVSFSRSGDSSEGVAVIESALERYPLVRHLIITCNGEGRMARDFKGRENVFRVVLDDEVNDRGLAMTSSFSNMVVTGQCLAHVRDLTAYEPILGELVSCASTFRGEAADAAARLAGEGFSKVCFLGTGALRGVAVESALKVVELTAGRVYTWSESYLGVRHGPLSAVDKETLVVGFLSGDARLRSYEADLLREVRAKRLAGKIITIGPPEQSSEELSDTMLRLGFRQKVADLYRPPVDVIFGQLFGLFSSLKQGLKPDTPSPKGAISRVVEGVKVY